MLRFQHINHLVVLAAIPLFIALYMLLLAWRRKNFKKWGDHPLVQQQVLGYIPGRRTLKFILLASAFALVAIGWANLQSSSGDAEEVERKGLDVIVALDVSKSMMAEDMQPNRLAKAKLLVERLMDKLHNDRVGLIVFAGRAYLQVPLTVDYASMRMMLQNVAPDIVPTQGTVIGDAIELAMQSFSQKEKKYKSLIIISDGEDHDEKASEKVQEAANAGIVVHTVGVGTPEGYPLVDYMTKQPKLDEKGNQVVSKLNVEELKNIAAEGRGTYNLLTNVDNVATALADNVDNMEKRSIDTISFTNYDSYFQYFLLPALLLLIIEWLIPNAKKYKSNKTLATKTMATIIALLLITILSSNNSWAQEKPFVKKGNQLYQQKKYAEATQAYMQALQKNPSSVPSAFNLGNALIQQKKYEEARNVMNQTTKITKDKNEQAGANYNVGNTYMAEQKWQEAVDAYKQALRKNPQDIDAKYNLSYALAKMKQQQQNGGGKNKDDKNKDQQNKDKNQQDNKDKQQDKKDQQGNNDKDQQNEPKDDKQDNGKGDDEKKEQKQPQPQPSKLSKEKAESILNALQQEEKKLQDKKHKEKGAPIHLDKDW